MLLIIILHALFALSFPLARLAMQSAEPMFFTAFRMLIAGAILLFYQRLNNVNFISDFKNNFISISLLSFFNVFLTNVCEFWSLKYLQSSKAAFIYALTPFLTALISYFFINEEITKKKLLGMLIGFLGFILMLSQHYPTETKISGFFFLSWPELAMICAAFATTIGWIVMRYVMQKEVSVVSANGLSMVFGGIMSLVASIFLEYWHPLPISNYHLFIESAFSLILVSNIICYNLYTYLLKFYTSTLMAFSGFIEPIFAAIFGWLILSETVTWQFVVSFSIVIIGLYIFYSDELGNKK